MLDEETKGYSLYLLGPFWRVAEGHEYTVGQNGAHDDHAEYREGEESRKYTGVRTLRVLFKYAVMHQRNIHAYLCFKDVVIL